MRPNAIDQSIQYFKDGTIPYHEHCFYCESRDQVQARFPKWFALIKNSISDQNEASYALAILGELANNSFDHNLGQWKDKSGCVVGFEVNKEKVILAVADRGQGIVNSLAPTLTKFGLSKDEALVSAFEKIISGRHPEQRGNGLKFVTQAIEQESDRGLICYSNRQIYKIGNQKPFADYIKDKLVEDSGTLTIASWK